MATTLPGEYLDPSLTPERQRQRCTLSQLGTDNPDPPPVFTEWKCNDANWTDDYDRNIIDIFKIVENPTPPTTTFLPILFGDSGEHMGQTPDFTAPPFTDVSQVSTDAQIKTLQFANYVAEHGIPISTPHQEHLYRDFNVCGPGKWYSSATEVANLVNPLYSANQCNHCPGLDNEIFTDDDIKDRHYDQGAFEDMYEQCYEGDATTSPTTPPTAYAPLTKWFPNQLERNMNALEIAASGETLAAERGNIDWANWETDESVSRNWTSRDGPTDASELERELMLLYPDLDYSGLTCLNGQPCGNLDDVSLKIFSDLGISGDDCSGLTWSDTDEYGDPRDAPPVCTPGTTFGENPNAIVPEMVRQWTREQIQNPQTHALPGLDDLMSSYFVQDNPQFEMCINHIFETNEADRNILRRIHGYNGDFTNFNEDDIEYVRRKMLKFIFAPRSQVAGCLDDLYINANQICNEGLTDKMSKVAFVLFYILGIEVDLSDLDQNDEKSQKVRLMMDSFGPLVPQMIKRIIEVSKYEETLRCGGEPTNNTLLMERLFDDIFVNSGRDVQMDLGVDMDYFLEMSNGEFGKLMLMGGMGLKYLTTFFAM